MSELFSTTGLNPDEIHVNPGRLRKLQPDLVDKIAESMEKVGQLASILVVLRNNTGTVCGLDYVLVAGRHRLEAAKKLKWKSIRCTIFPALIGPHHQDGEDHAALAEIDENLMRADLSPAERALRVDARKALYEKLHSETKHGMAPVGRGGKKEDAESASSFVKDTA